VLESATRGRRTDGHGRAPSSRLAGTSRPDPGYHTSSSTQFFNLVVLPGVVTGDRGGTYAQSTRLYTRDGVNMPTARTSPTIMGIGDGQLQSAAVTTSTPTESVESRVLMTLLGGVLRIGSWGMHHKAARTTPRELRRYYTNDPCSRDYFRPGAAQTQLRARSFLGPGVLQGQASSSSRETCCARTSR